MTHPDGEVDEGARADGDAPSAEALVIHPQWQAWAVENLVHGAAAEDVIAELVDEGVPPEQARALVRTLADSPVLPHARALWRRVGALEQIVRLRRDHRTAQAAGHTEIPTGPLPAVEDFLARHWVPGVPRVVTDLVTRWPAFTRWEPTALAERLGDALIEACEGREAASDPDATWQPLRTELPLRTLLERITTGGPSNDLYVIAKNAALRRPALRPLLDDLVLPPEYFGPTLDPTRMGLWIGPAGTHTPLHHDGDDSMFCQVVGRKRFRLAPPESVAMLDRSRGVYSHWDPRDQAALREGPEPLIELLLEPGQALFIPAGWWHQVDALDPSVSVSILAFAWPNDYGWYRPGSLLRGSRRA